MALTAGAQLGPHRILALIGAGGMGEVYKATDTRLNRMSLGAKIESGIPRVLFDTELGTVPNPTSSQYYAVTSDGPLPAKEAGPARQRNSALRAYSHHRRRQLGGRATEINWFHSQSPAHSLKKSALSSKRFLQNREHCHRAREECELLAQRWISGLSSNHCREAFGARSAKRQEWNGHPIQRPLGSCRFAFFGVCIAPAVEEIVFRGFLFKVFSDLGGTALAIPLTAALFALLHAPPLWGGWAGVVLIFGVGYVFSYIRGRSNSLIPSLVMHRLQRNVVWRVCHPNSSRERRAPVAARGCLCCCGLPAVEASGKQKGCTSKEDEVFRVHGECILHQPNRISGISVRPSAIRRALNSLRKFVDAHVDSGRHVS